MTGGLWLAWRQQRGAVVATALAVAAAPWLDYLRYHYYELPAPPEVTSWAFLLIAVLGFLWAATLLAREQQRGTIDLAYTQSVTRARWLTIRILPPLLAALAAPVGAIALSQRFGTNANLLTYYGEPFATMPSMAGLLCLTVAVGLLAGAVLRRTVPAMAITAASFYVSYRAAEVAAVDLRPTPELVVRRPEDLQALNHVDGLLYTMRNGQTRMPYTVEYVTKHSIWVGTWLECGLYLAAAAVVVALTYYWMTRRVPRG